MELDVELIAPPFRLRPFSLRDCPAHVDAALESHAEVHPWLGWCHAEYSLAESEAWVTSQIERFEADLEYQFAIRDDEGVFLGGCGINQISMQHGFANLGYWVRTSAAGRGVASAATVAVARFGFERVGLQRIEIVVAPDNVGSARVAEKAGAVREGVLRSRLRQPVGPSDAIMFSLVPEDLA